MSRAIQPSVFVAALLAAVLGLFSTASASYSYDGQSVIEERDAADARLRFHVNGAQYIDERVATFTDASGEFTYYLGSNNFSVTGTGNADGSVIERMDYSSTGDFAGGGPGAASFYHEADDDLGLDLRDFASFQNCFGQTDPTCLAIHDFDTTDTSDGDIDLDDYARLFECFRGPFVTPDQVCGNRASQVLFLRTGLAIERAQFALETPAVSAAQAARAVMVPAGATTTTSLRVLSPGFVPDPSRVLQNLTTAENVALAANPRLALGVLSRPEYVASQRLPTVARLSYGKAVERLAREEILEDPLLRTIFDPSGIGRRGPDILGIGPAQGLRFDITTANARTIAEHLARPYRRDLIIITYERPADFVVFPP